LFLTQLGNQFCRDRLLTESPAISLPVTRALKPNQFCTLKSILIVNRDLELPENANILMHQRDNVTGVLWE